MRSDGARVIYNGEVTPLKLLFICFANTCRSPMAEAIARGMAGRWLQVYSAGLRPTGTVAPLARRTVRWLGHSPNGLTSKGLEDVPLREMDFIVSLMGPQGLLELPGDVSAEKIVWMIRDPYGEDEAMYRRTGRALEDRIRRLLDEIGHREPFQM